MQNAPIGLHRTFLHSVARSREEEDEADNLGGGQQCMLCDSLVPALPAMPGNLLLRWRDGNIFAAQRGPSRLRDSELLGFPRPRPVLLLPRLPLLPFSFNRYPPSSFSCLQLSARFYGHPTLEYAHS